MADPILAEEEAALRQVERLGYSRTDVRHVVLTHLDVDHCGGLPDFPHATVHVMAAEVRAAPAEAPSGRYRSQHWAHGPRWATYGVDGDQQWFGFDAVPLRGLPEMFLVPLGGHTRGHAGVAVRDGARWLLHAGDAYYYHRELTDQPEPHPLLDFVQTTFEVHRELRLGTQARLRELVRSHGDEVTVFSARDP